MSVMENVISEVGVLKRKGDGKYPVKDTAADDLISAMENICYHIPHVTTPEIKLAEKDQLYLPISLLEAKDKGAAFSGNLKIIWKKGRYYSSIRFFGNKEVHLKTVIGGTLISTSMKLDDLFQEQFRFKSLYELIESLIQKQTPVTAEV